jgi:hypothetical protein
MRPKRPPNPSLSYHAKPLNLFFSFVSISHPYKKFNKKIINRLLRELQQTQDNSTTHRRRTCDYSARFEDHR